MSLNVELSRFYHTLETGIVYELPAQSSDLPGANVSRVFTAQIIGHSSPSILQTYARAIDEFKVRNLEA